MYLPTLEYYVTKEIFNETNTKKNKKQQITIHTNYINIY